VPKEIFYFRERLSEELLSATISTHPVKQTMFQTLRASKPLKKTLISFVMSGVCPLKFQRHMSTHIFSIHSFKQTSTTYKPNVMVEWLALLLHIRKVPGSNLGLQTGYPD
jgi:hypothetical protein